MIKSIWRWVRGHYYRTCVVCGKEFRRYPCSMPSLAGYTYCTTTCEKRRWDDWVKGVNRG